MPKGYLIANAKLIDAEAYKTYSARNNELLPRYGGKFLVRGGANEIVEGEARDRSVVIEFPSYADARAFYNDPDYRENMKIRLANAESTIIIAEGI